MIELMYFETPNYCVPFIGKVASTTTARVIVETFYPEQIDYVKYNSGDNWEDTPIWQVACPKTTNPTKPIACLIRNPIDRFKSAIVQSNIQNVDLAISKIRNNELWQFEHLSDAHLLKLNPHFRIQSDWINGYESHLFKFPDHINEFFQFIGITVDIPNLNNSGINIQLSQQVTNLVTNYYSEDLTLFNSIISPNTLRGV